MSNILSDKSEAIVIRWFEAFDSLLASGEIKSVRTFCAAQGFAHAQLNRLRYEPWRKFELEFLAVLVRDYGIKAHWLITGNGPKGF